MTSFVDYKPYHVHSVYMTCVGENSFKRKVQMRDVTYKNFYWGDMCDFFFDRQYADNVTLRRGRVTIVTV